MDVKTQPVPQIHGTFLKQTNFKIYLELQIFDQLLKYKKQGCKALKCAMHEDWISECVYIGNFG